MTRINFLKRIWLSITDFRIYPYSQKEKARTAIWFFLRLVFVCAIVISAFLTNELFNQMPSVIAKFDEIIPNFSITDGKLVTNEELNAEFNQDTYIVFSNKLESSNILNIVSNVKEDKSINKKYSGYILILNDQASYVYDLDGAVYQAFKVNYSDFVDTNKTEMIKDLTDLTESFASKMIIFSTITLIFFAFIIINRSMTSIIYAITIALLNTIFALKLRFRNYIIIICYVSVLPIILETIAIIVTKQISSPVNLVCTLISFVYIFYGLRAIKIDNIITNGVGNNPLEKLENAIKEAQEEIEEQLKEKTEENKEEKSEDEKEISNDSNNNDDN